MDKMASAVTTIDSVEECRAIARAKIAEADRDKRHRRRLLAAAEAWELLALLLSEQIQRAR